MYKSFTLSLSLLSGIVLLCSFKKKKLYGVWSVNAVSYDVRDSNNVRFTFWKDEFKFDTDSTGARLESLEDNYANAKRQVTKRGYAFSVPFKYSVTTDDIGHLMAITYDRGSILKVEHRDSVAMLNAAAASASKLSYTNVKFYFSIKPDSVKRDMLYFQFMKPGTNVVVRFQKKTQKHEKQVEKRLDKSIKKNRKKLRKNPELAEELKRQVANP